MIPVLVRAVGAKERARDLRPDQRADARNHEEPAIVQRLNASLLEPVVETSEQSKASSQPKCRSMCAAEKAGFEAVVQTPTFRGTAFSMSRKGILISPR